MVIYHKVNFEERLATLIRYLKYLVKVYVLTDKYMFSPTRMIKARLHVYILVLAVTLITNVPRYKNIKQERSLFCLQTLMLIHSSLFINLCRRDLCSKRRTSRLNFLRAQTCLSFGNHSKSGCMQDLISSPCI